MLTHDRQQQWKPDIQVSQKLNLVGTLATSFGSGKTITRVRFIIERINPPFLFLMDWNTYKYKNLTCKSFNILLL